MNSLQRHLSTSLVARYYREGAVVDAPSRKPSIVLAIRYGLRHAGGEDAKRFVQAARIAAEKYPELANQLNPIADVCDRVVKYGVNYHVNKWDDRMFIGFCRDMGLFLVGKSGTHADTYLRAYQG